jgi:alpha-amylase/alpha-mannosidase (GH57 family)
MSGVLDIALLWHMHQPEYRDLRTGRAGLPWVRLHAADAYGRMARLLAEHPRARVTVNFTPCLVEALADWAAGGPPDDWARRFARPLTAAADRRFVLRHAFSGPMARTARLWPAYARLYERRLAPESLTPVEARTLVGLFELGWIDPARLGEAPALARLAEEGGPPTGTELVALHDLQRRLAAEVLPAWRRLADRGQVALSTSPYYHPILPLLAGPAAALEARPDLVLPGPLAPVVEDARWQLAEGLARHQAAFGRPAVGVWPSEGALSQAVAGLLPPGVRWLATDQALLGRSLGAAAAPDAHLRPWRVDAGGRDVLVYFRDTELSDRIGFRYAHVGADEAVADFIAYCQAARRWRDGAPGVLVVALDGENPWGTFPDGGEAFLRTLYWRLSSEPGLRMSTLDALSARRPEAGTLPRLAAGSWIHGDLSTWIGDPAQNRAWELLAGARSDLVAAAPEPAAAPLAWRSLGAAEGSDWFWWYGHRHHSEEDPQFDAIFRRHLANTYRARGVTPPRALARALAGAAGGRGTMSPGRDEAGGG